MKRRLSEIEKIMNTERTFDIIKPEHEQMSSSFWDKIANFRKPDLLDWEKEQRINGNFYRDNQFQIDSPEALIQSLKHAIDTKVYNKIIENVAMEGFRENRYSDAVSEEITLLLTTMKLVCEEREPERAWIVDTSTTLRPIYPIVYKGSALSAVITQTIDDLDDEEIK